MNTIQPRLTGDQIKAIREGHELSRSKFAHICGRSSAGGRGSNNLRSLVIEWEEGRKIPSQASTRLMLFMAIDLLDEADADDLFNMLLDPEWDAVVPEYVG